MTRTFLFFDTARHVDLLVAKVLILIKIFFLFLIELNKMDDGPPVAFYVASLLGTFRSPISLGRYNLKSEVQQLEEVIQLCQKIGELNEANVIGQFESQFQSDIADLDEADELVFDVDELI